MRLIYRIQNVLPRSFFWLFKQKRCVTETMSELNRFWIATSIREMLMYERTMYVFKAR